MTAQEIIESGKLELYVSGVLCGKERDQIAAAIKGDPMLQREVQAIEEAMIAALNEGKFEPRAGVKDKILNAVTAGSSDGAGNGKPAASEIKNQSKVVRMNPVNVWLAAASVALLISLGFSVYMFNQKISSQQAAFTQISEKYINQLSTNDSSKIAQAKVNELIALINHQNTKKIILNGVKTEPDARAVVYWNTLNGRIIINPSSLPAPPSDKQYQLWALLDGKPIDAGVFNTSTNPVDLQEGKVIGNAQAFAVTLEQKGGASSPTLSAMYVMGTI